MKITDFGRILGHFAPSHTLDFQVKQENDENYKKSNDGATYHGNWLKQTATTIKEHPRINYTRVIAKDNYCPEELNILSNYSTMELEHFLRIFSI